MVIGLGIQEIVGQDGLDRGMIELQNQTENETPFEILKV
jgi:hypothetical protein